MSDNKLNVDHAIEMLKSSGVRITPQRHAILEYLVISDTHPTADEIYKTLEHKFPNMSVATVYNNLRVFKKTGLVKELTYGDASSRFDFSTKRHYHVICSKCGKIVDFFYPALDEIEALAAQVTGFKVDHHRLEIYGICPECQAKDVQDQSESVQKSTVS
ncbi:peroxide-responsive transcriptional repressor PerR [Sporolactobacillus sp. CPB3-1]|uniref:Peroxide-responsive transcriptional repressor PerR n=1 Tax=Sporolactobacillus mangiferae TaxID=2940498 RepID=A0ABT0MAY5_9BACL|nr:peroxide-responsive transcriptional repressor PerR [Sporolactobacillus mangiferae]MCL1632024.1 peroxide-responsive transcriptional repressor PerR [Sporolactobacillus mangiferae]